MQDAPLTQAHILVVDDQQADALVVQSTLQQGGYVRVTSAADPRRVASLYTDERPDLIVLSLAVPDRGGLAALAALHPLVPDGAYLPILILGSGLPASAKQQALALGAREFLAKPIETTDLLLTVKNLLETRALHRRLKDKQRMLEEDVRQRTAELEEARRELLARLSLVAEYRDDESGQHAQRVGRIAARVAEALGLDAPEVELILRSAPLHDIGKVGIADRLLLKPARFTTDEAAQMQRHTSIGATILSGSQLPLLVLAEEIARTHHERWDGTGYPRGLAGEAIPLVGRIVAVADVFDALTHARPYRAAWPVDDALAEIARQSGRQFDPRVVTAFMRLQGRDGGAAPTPPPIEPSATRTVLYIDSTLADLELVERILAHRHKSEARARPSLTARIMDQQPQMTLLTAMAGQRGLELARDRRPDLILLDLNLPDLKGENVLRALRDDPITSRIPVVVLSADTSARHMRRLLDAGAQAYLTKPLELKHFTEVLTRIFRQPPP